MPGEVLTGPEGETFAGFFGKLPTTGDFVSRGLPDGFRRNWDLWVTRHLAPRQRKGAGWPEGGLRFRLVSGGRIAAGVVVPGSDSAGRPFPLSLILIGPDLPMPEALDRWCDAALSAAGAAADPDDLWDRLEGIDAPARAGSAPDVALLLWARRSPAISTDAADPADGLDRIFTKLSSS